MRREWRWLICFYVGLAIIVGSAGLLVPFFQHVPRESRDVRPLRPGIQQYVE